MIDFFPCEKEVRKGSQRVLSETRLNNRTKKISEKIMPQVNEWQTRPLEGHYPFIFKDAIHYKIRENHQIVTKAAYVVLGINNEGYKEILGIWVGGNESSKFWLGGSEYSLV